MDKPRYFSYSVTTTEQPSLTAVADGFHEHTHGDHQHRHKHTYVPGNHGDDDHGCGNAGVAANNSGISGNNGLIVASFAP